MSVDMLDAWIAWLCSGNRQAAGWAQGRVGDRRMQTGRLAQLSSPGRYAGCRLGLPDGDYLRALHEGAPRCARCATAALLCPLCPLGVALPGPPVGPSSAHRRPRSPCPHLLPTVQPGDGRADWFDALAVRQGGGCAMCLPASSHKQAVSHACRAAALHTLPVCVAGCNSRLHTCLPCPPPLLRPLFHTAARWRQRHSRREATPRQRRALWCCPTSASG